MKNNNVIIAGPNCDEELFSRNVQQKSEPGYGSVIGGIFAGIMGIAIFCAAWMYHRRRVANLKMEIAQVQYIAEPVTPPGNNLEKLTVFFLQY